MARGRARYRFANEAPDWRYQRLIFDEAPEMVAQRRRVYENSDWEYLNTSPPEHLKRLQNILWTLMELPPSKRRKEVRRAPHRDPELADLLLEESEKALARGIAEASDDKARTAEWIADVVPVRCQHVSAISARSRILQAAARQLVGQSQNADVLFRSALDALAECPDRSAWAFFFKTLARVREQQRRLAEAAAFLSRARDLYEDWDFPAEQWCLRRLGRLCLGLNDPGRAMAALVKVDIEEASNHAKAEVFLGMAACLAAIELREPARLLLRQSRAERRWIRSREHRRPLEWWDARIAARLGDLEDAIPRLDGVRRDHLQSKRWVEACSTSVELLLAYARTGTRKRKSRPDVFGQLSQAFQDERETFDFLPFAEDRKPLEAALRDAADHLERQGFPEAASCRSFLEHVQSLPPSPRAASILRRKGSDFDLSAATEDLLRTIAVSRRPSTLPDDEERHDD